MEEMCFENKTLWRNDESRFGAENVKGEPGTFCLIRKQKKLSKNHCGHIRRIQEST